MLPVGPVMHGFQPANYPSLHPHIPSPSSHQSDHESRFTKEGIYWLENQQNPSICRGVVDLWEGSGGFCGPFGQLGWEHPFLCGTAGVGGWRTVITFHIVLYML